MLCEMNVSSVIAQTFFYEFSFRPVSIYWSVSVALVCLRCFYLSFSSCSLSPSVSLYCLFFFLSPSIFSKWFSLSIGLSCSYIMIHGSNKQRSFWIHSVALKTTRLFGQQLSGNKTHLFRTHTQTFSTTHGFHSLSQWNENPAAIRAA